MTEAEWRGCADLEAMLKGLQGLATDRKLRLFAVACWWRSWAGVQEHERQVLELFAGYVDGTVSPGEWFEGYSGAGGARLPDRIQLLLRSDPITAAGQTAQLASGDLARRQAWYGEPINFEAPLEERVAMSNRRYEFEFSVRTTEEESQVVLLRDIFGNPFRPVVFDPEWRTDTAIALARGMYESRDFSPMPILADALQDAGCDSDDILTHCRDAAATHVRGCWVVDLVLGKS